MRLTISAIILTYNEERNIRDCLESIYKWVDEIFIIDSGSTDKTLELAWKYTDKIYHHPFENFAQQRNWAQKILPIKNEWVFHLDADERVSPELASELRKILYSNLDADGFMMPRRTIFRGRWIKYGGHYPVYHLRIFKKNRGKCEDRLYDQHYEVEGKTERIKGYIINIIDSDLKLWKQKHKRWAILEAQEFLANRKLDIAIDHAMPMWQRRWLRYRIYYKMPIFIRTFLYFFYRYFLRLGFLDGRQGLIFHFYQGFWYRFLVDLEIYRLKRKA